MRVQPVLEAEPDRLRGDIRRQRLVRQELPHPAAERRPASRRSARPRRASPGPPAPWWPTIGSTSPSRLANTTADDGIRPVARLTRTPAVDGAPGPRRSSASESTASASTRVPSMSSAIIRIGKAGSGRVRGRWSSSDDGPRSTTRRGAAAPRGPASPCTASRGAPRRPPRRSPRPGPHRSPGARPRRARAPPAGARAARRITSRPSGPPSSAEAGSNARSGASVGEGGGRDVGQVRADHRVPARRPPAGGRPPGSASGPRPRGPTAFSRARSSASGQRSTATTVTCSSMRRFRRAASSATAIAPVPVPTSAIRSGGAPARPRRRREPGDDRRDGLVDEQLRLGSRDERPGVRRDRQAVELAEPADVGDGLAALRRATYPSNARELARRRRRAAPYGEDARRGPRPSAAPISSSASSRGDGAAGGRRGARWRGRPARRRWAWRRPSRLHPDRDVEVRGLADHLRRRAPAPAVEQQVGRVLADPQAGDRDLRQPVGQLGAPELQLAADRRAAGGRASSRGTGTRSPRPRPAASTRPGTAPGPPVFSRSKPQNSSGSRKSAKCWLAWKIRPTQQVGLVVEPVALEARARSATRRAATPCRCGSRWGCSRAGRGRRSGAPSR